MLREEGGIGRKRKGSSEATEERARRWLKSSPSFSRSSPALQQSSKNKRKLLQCSDLLSAPLKTRSRVRDEVQAAFKAGKACDENYDSESQSYVKTGSDTLGRRGRALWYMCILLSPPVPALHPLSPLLPPPSPPKSSYSRVGCRITRPQHFRCSGQTEHCKTSECRCSCR